MSPEYHSVFKLNPALDLGWSEMENLSRKWYDKDKVGVPLSSYPVIFFKTDFFFQGHGVKMSFHENSHAHFMFFKKILI